VNVVLCTNMYPSVERPNAGIFVEEQVADLRKLGVHIEVLAFDASKDRRQYLRAAARLRRLVQRAGADLVHAHYGLTGAVALAERRLPVVTTFHGSDASGYIPWQRRVSWFVARLSTPIFVARHLALRLGLPDAAVIPAAVDTELLVPSDITRARRRLGWAPDRRYALLPGARRNPVKRADLFDAAVAHARREMTDLVGVSLENFTRAQVADVMNAVDVCVLTSDFEGSPVAVRESLACNTPVVSVPVADMSLLLAGLPGCAVVARDARSLGDAIVKALQSGRSPELRVRAELDSRPRVAERLLALYGEVAR
jgi:teichuronic acid biosynthesis glycosyltransferase TuaC